MHRSPEYGRGGAGGEGWLVTLGDRVVQVETNQPDVDRMLNHVFGSDAAVAPAIPGSPPVGAWTISAVGSTDYEARMSAIEARFADEGEACGLADYWRGDFSARRMGKAGDLSAVRHSAPFEGCTLFEGRHKAVTYFFPAGTPLFMPHLEHLIAYVLRLEGWERGFVDVHAAFVHYRGKGVALVGPRQAGKTSLAMHLLARRGELLGSDMAQIRLDARHAIEAVSIPHMCRITRETVLDNGTLGAARSGAWDDNDEYKKGPLFSHGKYELYQPSLDRAFQRPVGISAMILNAILFPHFATDLARHHVSATTKGEGERRLISSIRADRPLADWLPFDVSARERSEARLEHGLTTGDWAIPAYDFRFGREASLDWDDIDALFDRI